MPNWANDNYIFDNNSDFNNIDPNNNSISRYYYDMTKTLQSSNQQFKLTATFVPVVLDNYLDATSWDDLDIKVMEKLKNTPNIQAILQTVDNRGSANFLRSNANDVSGDWYVDYCVFNYRYVTGWTSNDGPIPNMNNWYGSGGGLSGIAEGQIGNYKIGGYLKGHCTVDGLKPNLKVFTHELGHNLYDPPHYGGCNNTLLPYINTTSFGGMMPDIKNEVYGGANAWESWYLGWINIKHELNNPNNNGDYVIDDYLTTGDAIRIKLPYVENQYIWLENHKGESVFDKRTRWVDYLCGYSLPSSPTGLLIYLEKITSNKSEVNVYSNGSGIKLIHKQGNFDFSIKNLVVSSQLCNNTIPNFIINNENPFSGISKASRFLWDKNNDGEIHYPNSNNIGSTEITEISLLNDEYIYGNFATEAGFQVGDLLGIGTNPPIVNMQPYDNNAKKLSPIYLNGISIKVLEKDATGKIKVRIKFDDFDFNNDIRMCGDIVFPPENININANITMDKSGTVNRTDKLNGNFINPSIITTATNSNLKIKENKSIVIKDETIFVLEGNSTLDLSNDAKITVEPGANLILKSNSNLILHGNSKIEIKDGAFLCVEQGANINLLDAGSVIKINPQISLGKNSYAIARNLSGNCIYTLENIVKTGCGSIIDFTRTETTSNETWTTPKKLGEDFTVKSGHILQINNTTITMLPDVKIKVEPGAQLLINNSTLTSSCNAKYWDGIEVQGQSNKRQLTQYQGRLEIANCTIQNARNAVSLWKADDWSSMGGIVIAHSCVFKNNIRSIEFMPYSNNNGNVRGIIPNVSIFNSCSFYWDNDMYTNDKESLYHVTMCGVEGVQFIACNFNTFLYNNDNIIKHGIYSENGGFKVLGKLNQDQTITRSQFTNLHYGIRASNLSNKNLNVTNSFFNNNFDGIFLTSANGVEISNNEFIINTLYNPKDIYPNKSSYGIVTNNCTGYKVQQNSFSSNILSGNDITTGIQTKNSGQAPNIINDNQFTNLFHSVEAIGLNRNKTDFTGLQYRCNDFINSKYGILVTTDVFRFSNGIAMYQSANQSKSAENLFAQNTSIQESDIYNHFDCSRIFYFYKQGINKEPMSISPNVGKNPVNDNYEVCIENYSLFNDATLDNKYQLSESQFLNLLYNYNNLLDGGSTDLLLTKLQDSWDGEVWDLRNEYLGMSPYLSPEVLIELAYSFRLPLAVYLEVALSNPDATRRDEYIEFMNKVGDGESVLTEAAKGLIEDSWETTTFRTNMENNIATELIKMENISRTLIDRKINDTTGLHLGDYRSLLSNLRNIDAKYELVDSYIDMKEYSQAEGILNSMLGDEKYSKDYDDINDYLIFIDIMNDRDSTDQVPIDERIVNLANSSSRVGAKAKSILYFNGQLDYHPDYVTLTENTKARRIKIKAPLGIFEADVAVFPNPAKEYIAITYNLKPITGKYSFKIFDNMGKMIYNGYLNSNKGVQNIDLRSYEAGTYLYTVENSNEVSKRGKFVIVK